MLESENCSIRYLMREMDPSEEIEFEREMMEDENLLIEVESLRKTYQKMGKLPLMDPPGGLSNNVSKSVISAQQKRLRKNKQWMFLLTKAVAAAAILLMVVSTGLYFYDITPAVEESAQPNLATEANVVEPWVDRNNVIMFVGTSIQPNNDQSLQSDVDESFSKLTLVNSETGITPSSRKIVLTSSSN